MRKTLLILAAAGLLAGCSTRYSERSGQGAAGDTGTSGTQQGTETGTYDNTTRGVDNAAPPGPNNSSTPGSGRTDTYHNGTSDSQGTRMPENPNNP